MFILNTSKVNPEEINFLFNTSKQNISQETEIAVFIKLHKSLWSKYCLMLDFFEVLNVIPLWPFNDLQQ